LRPKLIALRAASALSEINGILELGEIHRTIKTVHGNAVVWLVDILLVVVLLLLLLFGLLLPFLWIGAIGR
jgi:hypothetical protein